MAQREFEQIYPKPGWVEHNPMEIWSTQYAVMSEAMALVGAKPKDIAGIGITNQRETTIVWDKETGEPVYNAIVWQCRRTAKDINLLVKDGYADVIKAKTGLVPDAYFSATKIAWILSNVAGARKKAEEGRLLFGTVDTWLIWKLTGGAVHVTDYTNASRTMLFDIHNRCWDKELLEKFNIPEVMLPKVKPSSCIYGYTDPSVLAGNVAIAGAAGDQQAALFGQCCFEPGEVKNTYGTGCFLLMNTGDKPVESKHGLITTIAAGSDDQLHYALEGSVFTGGAIVQWLRDEMRLIRSSSQSEDYARMVNDTNGVYIVPAFSGMGAPYWNPYARGCVVGLSRGANKEHFIRASLESIAYQTYDVLKAMESDTGHIVKELKVDGGASANDFLMEFQADILGAKIRRPKCIETTALGAAYLAGLAVGFFKDLNEIRDNWQLASTFESSMAPSDRDNLLAGWRRAVKCAISYTDE
jgi:glycerol kinase